MGSTDGNGSPEFSLQRFATTRQPQPKSRDPNKPPRQRAIHGLFTGYTDANVARLWIGGANVTAWYLLAVLNQVIHRRSHLYRDHRRHDPDNKTAWVSLTPTLLAAFHLNTRMASPALRQLERLRMVRIHRHRGQCPLVTLTWERPRT